MSMCKNILAVSSILILSACGEIQSVEYDNVDAARADGAFTRGWLPEWLPEWAEDIHEIHDLDSNASAFSFHMPPWSDESFREDCDTGITAPDPDIRVKNMPKSIAQNAGVMACGNFYVYKPEGRVIYAWRN